VQFLDQEGKPFSLPAGQAFQIAKGRRTIPGLPEIGLSQLGPGASRSQPTLLPVGFPALSAGPTLDCQPVGRPVATVTGPAVITGRGMFSRRFMYLIVRSIAQM